MADLFVFSKGMQNPLVCAEMVQPLGPCNAKVTALLSGLCAFLYPAAQMGRAGANRER